MFVLEDIPIDYQTMDKNMGYGFYSWGSSHAPCLQSPDTKLNSKTLELSSHIYSHHQEWAGTKLETTMEPGKEHENW